MPSLVHIAVALLRRHAFSLAGITLIVAVATLLVGAGYRARAWIAATQERWPAALARADLEVRFPPTTPGTAGRALDIEGVADAEERLLLPGSIVLSSGRRVPAVVHVLPEDGTSRLNPWQPIQGRLPGRGELCACVDRSVPASLGIALGESITVQAGGRARRLPVVGVARTAEYPVVPIHPDAGLPLRGSLAVVAISAAVAREEPDGGRHTSLLLRLHAGADPTRVREALASRLDAPIAEVTAPADDPGAEVVRITVDDFDVQMPSAVSVLVALGLLLQSIAFTRIVARQRPVVGALRALGHGRIALTLMFVPLATLPCVIGAVLGVVGHAALARDFYAGYEASLGFLPPLEAGGSLPAIMTGGACLLLALTVCVGAAWRLLACQPAELLRPAAAPRPNRATEALLALTHRVAGSLPLPSGVGLGLSNALRGGATTLASSVGLGAVFTVVAAFLMSHSSHLVRIRQAVASSGLDATVRLRAPLPEAALLPVADAAQGRVEGLVVGACVVEHGERRAFVRAVGTAPGAWTQRRAPALGRRFASADAHEILLDRWAARLAGVGPGDRVVLQPAVASPDSLEVEVVGILDGVTSGLALLPLEAARSVLGLQGLVTAAHVQSPLEPAALERALSAVVDVDSVTTTSALVAQVERALGGAARILWIGLCFALVVGTAFLAVVAAGDASDRRVDLAVLRALGWRDGALYRVGWTEVVARAAGALVVAWVAAPCLARWLLGRSVAGDRYELELLTPAWVPAALVVGTALTTPLAALPGWRAARRLPPPQVPRLLAAA